jgi:hypothetical protein
MDELYKNRFDRPTIFSTKDEKHLKRKNNEKTNSISKKQKQQKITTMKNFALRFMQNIYEIINFQISHYETDTITVYTLLVDLLYRIEHSGEDGVVTSNIQAKVENGKIVKKGRVIPPSLSTNLFNEESISKWLLKQYSFLQLDVIKNSNNLKKCLNSILPKLASMGYLEMRRCENISIYFRTGTTNVLVMNIMSKFTTIVLDNQHTKVIFKKDKFFLNDIMVRLRGNCVGFYDLVTGGTIHQEGGFFVPNHSIIISQLNGEYGVFAITPIPKNTILGIFCGELSFPTRDNPAQSDTILSIPLNIETKYGETVKKDLAIEPKGYWWAYMNSLPDGTRGVNVCIETKKESENPLPFVIIRTIDNIRPGEQLIWYYGSHHDIPLESQLHEVPLSWISLRQSLLVLQTNEMKHHELPSNFYWVMPQIIHGIDVNDIPQKIQQICQKKCQFKIDAVIIDDSIIECLDKIALYLFSSNKIVLYGDDSDVILILLLHKHLNINIYCCFEVVRKITREKRDKIIKYLQKFN